MTTMASSYMNMGSGPWFLMALGLLVLVAVLIGLGATLAGGRHTGGQAPPEEASALHLLDRRLALGEITAEERDNARRVLAGEREHAQT
jgi:uncharacterized membrane protein